MTALIHHAEATGWWSDSSSVSFTLALVACLFTEIWQQHFCVVTFFNFWTWMLLHKNTTLCHLLWPVMFGTQSCTCQCHLFWKSPLCYIQLPVSDAFSADFCLTFGAWISEQQWITAAVWRVHDYSPCLVWYFKSHEFWFVLPVSVFYSKMTSETAVAPGDNLRYLSVII